MMNIDFKFRSVGQGAFYSGVFKHRNGKQFSLVYDCGSDSSVQYINQEINHFANEIRHEKIDILFISHFHADHTNKISDLLSQTGGAIIAILPYLTPNELILAYTDVSVYGGGDPETLAFIQNPARFLLERKVEKVIFIHPSDDKDTGGSDEPNLKDPDLERILTSDFTFELLNQLVSNENIKEENQQVSHYYDLGRFSIVGFWEFKFFNKQRDAMTLNSFIQEIKNLLGTTTITFDDLATHIQNNATTYESNLSAIYGRNFGFGQLVNDTSLVIYHGPIINVSRIYIFYFIKYPFWRVGHAGTLLTGDIKFNQNCLDQIRFKWINNRYFENVGIFQIPHHGANHYIESTVITSYQNVYWWVINFGLGNKYRHPRQDIIDIIELNKHGGKIFPNTQVNEFRYGCLYR